MGKKGLSERMEEEREGRKETGIRRYIKWIEEIEKKGINLGIFLFFVK